MRREKQTYTKYVALKRGKRESVRGNLLTEVALTLERLRSETLKRSEMLSHATIIAECMRLTCLSLVR